jgi:hypothetical protein
MTEIDKADEPDSDLLYYIDFFVQKAKRHYLLLLPITALSAIVILIYVNITTPRYTAVAVVAPVQKAEGAMGALSSAAGQLMSQTGLGNLMTAGQDDTIDQFSRLLQSYRLASVLAQKDGFLQVIFADKWDAQTHHWKSRDDAFHLTIDGMKRLLRLPVKPAPDVDDLYDFLTKNLTIVTSKENDLVEVDLNYTDPATAQHMLEYILWDADLLLRENKRRDVAARIAYLKGVIPTITQEYQREATIGLLSIQEQSMMTIAADARFATAVVEKPHASIRPTWPSPTAVVVLILLLSVGLWTLAILVLPESNLLPKYSGRVPRLSSATTSPRARRMA